MFHKNSIEATETTFQVQGVSCDFWTTNFRIMWPSSETKLQVQGIVCIVSHKLLFFVQFFFFWIFVKFWILILLQIQYFFEKIVY
jgi:hypothetical protein